MFAATHLVGFGAGGGGDPFFSSVSLLTHFNGTNGSTTFTDSSSNAHTLTAVGNAQLSTTTPKFGTASLLCDGTGDYATVPTHTSLVFGTGDLTVETWLRVTGDSTNRAIISNRTAAGDDQWMLKIGATTNRLEMHTGSTEVLAATDHSTDFVSGTWYHVAWTRTGGTNYFFIDGTLIFSTATGGAFDFSSTNTLGIGNDALNGYVWYGNLDDLRITKGVARYTAGFTAPTAEFSDQ